MKKDLKQLIKKAFPKSVKKYSLKQAIEMMINKELEPYGVNIKDVRKNPEINGEPWYIHYTFKTEKDYEKWKKYCINLMLHQVDLPLTEEQAKLEFSFFALNYGLKCDYVDTNYSK